MLDKNIIAKDQNGHIIVIQINKNYYELKKYNITSGIFTSKKQIIFYCLANEQIKLTFKYRKKWAKFYPVLSVYDLILNYLLKNIRKLKVYIYLYKRTKKNKNETLFEKLTNKDD